MAHWHDTMVDRPETDGAVYVTGWTDFRPSRTRRNRGCLASWNLPGTNPRPDDLTNRVGPRHINVNLYGLSPPPRWGRFFWAMKPPARRCGRVGRIVKI
jgi:hypothetical protein